MQQSMNQQFIQYNFPSMHLQCVLHIFPGYIENVSLEFSLILLLKVLHFMLTCT